jgi:hypothetical protein
LNTESSSPLVTAPVVPRSELAPTLRRWFVAALKLLVGLTLTQFFLGSFLVVGWTQRVMRRATLEAWWRRSGHVRTGGTFAEFCQAEGSMREFGQWPNWFLGPVALTVGWRRLFGSLLANWKLGLLSAFNTAVFTLPAGLLWTFAWYAGWQNSFHKGYEHHLVGPLTFGFGVVLFVLGMFYVPLAQARQASTGDWRAFYQFGLVAKLIRRSWLASAGLAVLTAGLMFPVIFFKTLPFVFGYGDWAASKTPAELLTASSQYFFLTALWGFPAYVILRRVAARVYAHAVLMCVQRGSVGEDELSDQEWAALHQLDLIAPRSRRTWHWSVKLLAWLGTRTGQLAAGGAIALIWLVLTVQIFLGEFLKYTEGGRGWWNQPLIQLPWLDYTPTHLQQAVKVSRDR